MAACIHTARYVGAGVAAIWNIPIRMRVADRDRPGGETAAIRPPKNAFAGTQANVCRSYSPLPIRNASPSANR